MDGVSGPRSMSEAAEPASQLERQRPSPRLDSPVLRNGLSGGSGNRAAAPRCAALRSAAAPDGQGPRRGSAGRIFGLLGSLDSPLRLAVSCPEKKSEISRVLEAPSAPVWGSPGVHFSPLGKGASAMGGSFRPPQWGNSRVAMAPGTCCRGRPPGLGVQSIP